MRKKKMTMTVMMIAMTKTQNFKGSWSVLGEKERRKERRRNGSVLLPRKKPANGTSRWGIHY